jgi:flagellar assembly protein FliH
MRARILPRERADVAEPVFWRRFDLEESEDSPGEQSPDAAAGEGAPEIAPVNYGEIVATLEARLAAGAAEAAAREKTARDHGYQAGLREGDAAGRQAAQVAFSNEAAAIVGQVTQSVAQLVAFRARVRQQMEADLVRLSIAIARRIVYREIHIDPEALLGIVKAAIDKIETRELLRIRVAATDFALLERPLRDLLAPLRAEAVADASLPRGGVVVETTRGELDASVETQLAEIDRGLTDIARRPA